MSRICTNCSAQIADGMKFCPNCGTAAPSDTITGGSRFCAECGSPVNAGASFCDRCGKPLNAVQPVPETAAPPVIPASGVKYCANCGSPVKTGATFCGNCGKSPDKPEPLQQPVQMLSSQIARQAYYENMIRQNTAAVNLKPKRYIFLRVVLLVICAVLLFFGWRDGIRNVRTAMLEPSAFTTSPVDEDENIDDVQAEYDAISRESENGGRNADEDPPFYHELYDWFYRIPDEGGAVQ
ncbi:MAG: zinc ribbon domain-containing protein [Ruminiclostridium sp.]|nr:zinc ribbon domain-containing protein [Ruminiclostridium sp.]